MGATKLLTVRETEETRWSIPGRVLIDTSAWISFFRRQDGLASHTVKSILNAKSGVLTDMILAELLQGAKSRKEITALEELAQALPMLPHVPSTWKEAGLLSFELKRHGLTIHLSDCYLACLAIKHRCTLFSLDEHFRLIQRHSDLRLFASHP